jgi:hypothetical protein
MFCSAAAVLFGGAFKRLEIFCKEGMLSGL